MRELVKKSAQRLPNTKALSFQWISPNMRGRDSVILAARRTGRRNIWLIRLCGFRQYPLANLLPPHGVIETFLFEEFRVAS